jgi:hydrogenase maturation protease
MRHEKAGTRIVVVGIGNAYRGDDAVGRTVAHRLQERLPEADTVHIRLEDGEGTRLMESWSQAQAAILIDAMQSGGRAGTVRRLEAAEQPLPPVVWRGSTHTFGVAAAIELSRALRQLPARLIVYGIEGECFETGAALSAPVARVVPEVVQRVLHDLEMLQGALEGTFHA